MEVVLANLDDSSKLRETCPACGTSVVTGARAAYTLRKVDEPPLRFVADAAVGNADGVYDGAYDFGVEGEVIGTAQEIGEAVARYLASLSGDDVERMKLGTSRFYLQVVIELK